MFLAEHPFCEVPISIEVPGCLVRSSEVHHMKGRGIHFLSEEHWLAVCHSCHQWIEDHKKEARVLGLIRYT